MRVLVTGAGGFLGAHALARLTAEGHQVTAFLLPEEDPAELGARVRGYGGGEFSASVGRFEDGRTLAELLPEHLHVLHLAGWMRGDDPDRYREANVGLLEVLVALPGWSDAHRLVAVSSVAAAGPSTPTAPRSEEDPAEPIGLYGTSKRQGEEVLLGADLPARTLILRPPSIYGPGDPSFRDAFARASRGTYPALGPAELAFQLVFVEDLARALECALRRLDEDPPPPTLLHLGNPAVLRHEDWRAIFERVTGAPVETLHLGRVGTRAFGWWGALMSKLRGREELVGRDKVAHLLAGDWVHDLSGFDREVGGVEWTDHEEATRRTLEWYRDHDQL